MAQTKRKRRRKHRGTQGGKVDDRPRGRPTNRAEARQRAQQRRSGSGKRTVTTKDRGLTPPSWGSAVKKGLVAAAIFFALLAAAFGRPMPASAALAAFMLVFYVPLGYYTDRFFYMRRLRQQEQERIERAQARGGDQ